MALVVVTILQQTIKRIDLETTRCLDSVRIICTTKVINALQFCLYSLGHEDQKYALVHLKPPFRHTVSLVHFITR